MKKEPIALYIFRFALMLLLVAFVCMQYWSSILVEQELKTLRTDVMQMKRDIYAMQSNTNGMRNDILNQILKERDLVIPKPTELSSDLGERPHIDPNLPNLLEEDPFYITTLPEILGTNFSAEGTLHSATVGKPDNLHPFNNFVEVSAWTSQCTVSLARQKFGQYETFSPDMAIKIEARPMEDSGQPEFWVHLREGVYWQPLKQDFLRGTKLAAHFLQKHPVTAHDFKFYFDALMNPSNQEAGAVASRNYLRDIEELEVIDDLTLVVRWKTELIEEPDGQKVPQIKYVAKLLTGSLKPLPSFVYQYFPDGQKIVEDNNYRTNSVWAQQFSQHWAKNIIVSCGAWVFDGMTDRQIKFTRNPDHYFPYDVLVEQQEVTFKNSPKGIWQDFKGNKLDTYNIQPDQLIELETFLQSPQYQKQKNKQQSINRLDYLARSYTYIGWNQATPFFQSKKVRQALTLAIDRQRIISQNLNDMGIEIVCPFSIHSPAYDDSIAPWPFDPQRARELLEEEGWYDGDGDGVIDKMIDGKRVPFRFNLTYYVKNPTSKSISEYVATALKEIGIACNLNGVDIADLSSKFDEKSFDAIYLGWGLGTPPEDPRQLWHSSGAKLRGSSNAIGFANDQADAIIDQLQYEHDRNKRLALYHRFCHIIHEEAPYTFLYTPKVALLYREYLQNVFIPADRQDLIPGANVDQPSSSVFWLQK